MIIELFLTSLLFHTEALHKIITSLRLFFIQWVYFVDRLNKAAWNFDRLLQLWSINLLPFGWQRHVLTTAHGCLQAYLLSFFLESNLAFKDGFWLINFVFDSCAFFCLNLTWWSTGYRRRFTMQSPIWNGFVNFTIVYLTCIVHDFTQITKICVHGTTSWWLACRPGALRFLRT